MVINPLPFSIYYITIMTIAVIGLITTIYLSISHYRVYTDIEYKSFCAITKAINCDTVSQSPYSVVLNVPVAIWGLIGYVFIIILLSIAWKYRYKRMHVWPTIIWLSFLYSICSIILAIISSRIIKSYCIMCIVTYGVNFALVYFSSLIFNRFGTGGVINGLKMDVEYYKKNKSFVVLFALLSITSLIIIVNIIPPYWHLENDPYLRDLPTGVTADGHPWIGATIPELTIIEYTDYQCFQCKKMHYYIRQIVAKYPDKIRLVHRHFPMDNVFNPLVKEPYHQGSGKLSLLAIFATIHGKFWETNDFLFSLQQSKETIDIKSIADATGLNPKELFAATQNAYLKRMLRADILTAIKLGVKGTPGYIIDGKLFLGTFPLEMFSNLEGISP